MTHFWLGSPKIWAASISRMLAASAFRVAEAATTIAIQIYQLSHAFSSAADAADENIEEGSMSEHDENFMDIQLTPCRPEDNFGVMLVPTVHAISAAPTADYDGNNAKAEVDNGAKRKRRTMSQIQNLKETLASSYKEGIPLPFIAKRLNVRIDLLYKLFFALQVEGELSPPSADQTIIETPDVFKGILAKYGLTDAGLLKIEKSPDSLALVVSTFVG